MSSQQMNGTIGIRGAVAGDAGAAAGLGSRERVVQCHGRGGTDWVEILNYKQIIFLWVKSSKI